MSRPGLIALVGALIAGAALARPQVSPLLPQSPWITVQAPGGEREAPSAKDGPVDTLRALYPALSACWQAPEGLARFERIEITARFSLRRDGSVIGTPRITFTQVPGEERARDLLTRAALEAIARCTPVALTPALGGAIAGRPLTLRFIYQGPKGQGV